MQVLVLVPTTGDLNRVARIEAYPGLSHSFAVRLGSAERLPITKQYADFTLEGGPLAALGAPVKSGLFRLWLAKDIESGASWQLPVTLAHLVVALGLRLAEAPEKADIVLWSTGAVDLDLHIVEHNYMLPAKVRCSKTALQEAVAAGKQIVALVPACEDAAPVRALLEELGAQHYRVENVDNARVARSVFERELGLTLPAIVPRAMMPAAGEPAQAKPVSSGNPLVEAELVSAQPVKKIEKTVPPRPPWTTPVVIASVGTLALGAFVAGSQGLPWLVTLFTSPPIIQPPTPIPVPVGVSVGAGVGVAVGVSVAVGAPRPAPMGTPLPVPVKLQELRAENNGICLPFVIERSRMPPRAIDVALDEPDRFHDSTGQNLCMLEWTLNPEAKGVQGLDIIDLQGSRYGAEVSREAGGQGSWKKIRIAFRRDFSTISPNTITYNVKLKFNGAPLPEQVQQYRHTIR
jgi:hypothetical protein